MEYYWAYPYLKCFEIKVNYYNRPVTQFHYIITCEEAEILCVRRTPFAVAALRNEMSILGFYCVSHGQNCSSMYCEYESVESVGF